MDELLTDLKSYDKHKAFSREAKAGGRLQGEAGGRKVERVILGRRRCAGEGRLQWVQPTRGREGLQEEGCGEERVPIKGQGALRVLGRWWEEKEDDDEEGGGQVQPRRRR